MDMDNDKQKILILGAGGRLGTALVRKFGTSSDYQVIAVVHRTSPTLGFLEGVAVYQAELTERAVIKNLCLEELPDVIINAVALSDVDRCETQRELAWKVNVRIVEYLLQMCRLYDIALVHYSTDYVFDGRRGPYSEDDAPRPVNYYGRTKLASENLCRISPERTLILRTNVLYGIAPKPTFVHWVLDRLQENRPFSVVVDQYANPTLLDNVADCTAALIQQKATGLYHIGGSQWLSRYEFARLIAEVFDYDPDLIQPIRTSELLQVARRPLRAGLKIERIQQVVDCELVDPRTGLQWMKQQMQRSDTKE